MLKQLIILFFLLNAHLSFSQQDLTDQQWIEDLEFMFNRLDSIHPCLYCRISKDQLQARKQVLQDRISSLTDDEVVVELLKLVTLLEDGHTRLHGKNLTKKFYPVRIEKFSDGYYISAASEQYSGYIGAQLISVNNQPIESVFDLLEEVTPNDNSYGQEYFAPMYFSMSSILAGLHVTKSADEPLMIILKTPESKDEFVNISPADFLTDEALSWFWKDYGVPAEVYSNIMNVDTVLPLYLKNYSQPYWYDFIKEYNTVYFAFNQCINDETNSFADFNHRLWAYIDSTRADHLIIDLRNNLGGTNSYLLPLIHEIIKHDYLNTQGKLFLLTSKKTFSAAVDCAAWIEFQCNPIFAGQPTGAGPNHFGDPDFSSLPNSKILLMVSKYYWQDSWPWDNRRCIEPTVKVGLSSVDYFNYRDPVIEEIFKIIRQNKFTRTETKL